MILEGVVLQLSYLLSTLQPAAKTYRLSCLAQTENEPEDLMIANREFINLFIFSLQVSLYVIYVTGPSGVPSHKLLSKSFLSGYRFYPYTQDSAKINLREQLFDCKLKGLLKRG